MATRYVTDTFKSHWIGTLQIIPSLHTFKAQVALPFVPSPIYIQPMSRQFTVLLLAIVLNFAFRALRVEAVPLVGSRPSSRKPSL
jgi:hypothetical protein